MKNFSTKPAKGIHKAAYGEKALVTKLGKVNIVHLDNPSRETIRQRIEEVIREQITGEDFDDDCPLCQDLKNKPYDIIYHGLI